MTNRRCVVIMRGDGEMSKAIADGIATARAARLEPGLRRSREDEIIHQRTRERLMQMDIHGAHTARWWNEKWLDADLAYGEPLENPEWYRRAWKALGTGWALMWCLVLMMLGRRF